MQNNTGNTADLPGRIQDKENAALEVCRETAETLLLVEEKKEANLLLKMTGQSIAFKFRRPRDVFRAAHATPFDFDEVPSCIAHAARAFSSSTGFDRSGVIVSAVIAAAASIDDAYKLIVRPESNWVESARLWAVLIGTPSSGKSPSMRVAINQLKFRHQRAVIQWGQDFRELRKEEKPPEPAFYTSDTTIAAMSETLRGNPRGLLMTTEEFSTWIGGIDASDRGQEATNRGHWLQLYDGGPHQMNRINRGSVFVPNWGASVLAACTPDGLCKHMRKLPDDGLIHRFIPVIIGPRTYERSGDAREAIQYWSTWIDWLIDHIHPAAVTMEPDAKRLFDEEERSKSWLSESIYEASPQLASHLGKHNGMLARVALTFHALNDPGTLVLRARTMWMAVKFCRRVAKHAATMFDSILSTSPALSLARSLARSIVAEASMLTTIGRDWMSNHCAEFRNADDRVRREAVLVLEDADWLEPFPGARAYGGWHTTKWTIHERLASMFAREGQEWRARRMAVREAIGLEDPDLHEA